jgi:integrase/recombinase XerC
MHTDLAFPLARVREVTASPGPVAEGPPAPDELVALFLAGRRPTTLRAYRGALVALCRATGAEDVPDVARRLLRGTAGDANRLVLGWRAHMLERGLAPNTINGRLAAVRALVHLARLVGLVTWRLEVPGVRTQKLRDTKGPGRRGVRALLDIVAQDASPRGLRDRALLRLLTDLALRRAEVTSLDVAHVDLERGTAAVLGKGQRERTTLTLPEPTRVALADWIAARGDEQGPLFVGMSRGRPGTRLTGTSLARIVRQLGERAGVGPLRPHGLRHAAITEALELTRGDIRAVQRFSRHADPRTVLRYDDCRADRGGEVARQVAVWR